MLDWLLEENNPAIRYRTLTEILNKPADDPDVRKAYESIWQQKEVIRILSCRNQDGFWDTTEYGGHTALRYLTALAEFGLQSDGRLERAVAQSVEFLREKESCSGTQAYDGCSDALLLRALVMLGTHGQEDVVALLQRYSQTQLDDGGFICRRLLDKRPERKSCYKAAVAGLLLYAACRQQGVLFANTDRLVDYFTNREVFFKSDGSGLVVDGRAGWRYIDNFFPVEPMRVGLPLIVSSLRILGAGGQAMQKARDLLDGKKNENGRMVLEGTLRKQPCSFGKVGQENKWLNLYYMLSEESGLAGK